MCRVEAVIVAGGLGTRLLPLTADVPKPLLPVAGVPFVVHQLAKLAAAGVQRVLLATSYQANSFEPVLGDGTRWGLDLGYVTEEEPLGTAGAIRNAAAELTSTGDQPVVVLNSDILSGHDLAGQLARHAERRADVTLHLVEVPDARAFGSVPTDGHGNVTAFLEKATHPVSRQINAGCYVFTRAVIDQIPPGVVVSVERQTFPELLAGGARVLGHVDDSYWIDVGTPQALCRASADLVLGVATSQAYRDAPATCATTPSSTVAPTATLTAGSFVGAEASVGPGAEVTGSVVFARASIGAGAVIENSVIGTGARIGAGAVLKDCAVGNLAEVPPGSRLVAERVASVGGG